MSEEQQVAPTTEEVQETTEEQTDVQPEESEESKEETEESTDTTQYQEETERWKQRAEKAESKLAESAYKQREQKREHVDDDDDKPLTKKDLQEALKSTQAENQRLILENKIDSIAENLSSSLQEKELIKSIHSQVVFPSHIPLQEQLENAKLIANKKRILGENNELKRALKGKQGINTDSAGVTQKAPVSGKGEPSGTSEDRQALSQAGFTWNKTTKRYEKTTSSGITLYRDTNGSVRKA